jgi:hypothetical protein
VARVAVARKEPPWAPPQEAGLRPAGPVESSVMLAAEDLSERYHSAWQGRSPAALNSQAEARWQAAEWAWAPAGARRQKALVAQGTLRGLALVRAVGAQARPVR